MQHLTVRDVVEPMMEEEDWPSCLRTAEVLLRKKPAIADQAFLLHAMCKSHFALGDYLKGASAGEVAGYQVEDWDLLGEAIYRAGLCHYYARAYQQAIHHLATFLDHETRYTTALRFKGEVLFIRGCARRAMQQHRAAAEQYARAVQWAKGQGDEAGALLYQLNLVWALLEAEQLTEAEVMIGELEALAARVSEDPSYRLHALHDRAHLSYLTGNHSDAFTKAFDVIEQSFPSDPLLTGTALLTLHGLAWELGHTKEAIQLALVDWQELSDRAPRIKELFDGGDEVRIVAADTDLRFNLAGRPGVVCAGAGSSGWMVAWCATGGYGVHRPACGFRSPS